MPDLVEFRQDEPVRRCRPRQRGYAELRAKDPVGPGIELLGRVREAARSRDADDGIELIYSEFDRRFSRGRFADVDELLSALDPAKEPALPILHLLAIASITNAARDRLGSRPSFVARVREYLKREDPARVEELLAGLE